MPGFFTVSRACLIVAALGGLIGSAAAADLKVALSTNLNTLDPATATFGEEYVYSGLVFSALMGTDADGKVYPDLAVSSQASADLKSWDFKLRPGVRFQHGKPLTSEDVVFTFRRILEPGTGSGARSDLGLVESVEAVDDMTVRFKLSVPYASFPELLTGRHMRILASDRADSIKTSPSGTGPFRFVKYTPGDSVELERNPDYYGADRIKLDKVVLRIIPEAASRVAALRAGDIDMIWNAPLETIPDLKRNPDVAVDARPSGTWDGFVLNNTKPPFNDVRVRRAVYLTLDKRALVQFALDGQGEPTHSPIAPTDPAFNKAIGFQPNIAEAKRLMAEAGHPNGFKLDITVPVGRPARERLGVVAQQLLRQIGIQVAVQRVPYNRYSTEIAGIAPMYVDGFFARTVIDAAVYPWFHSKGAWNGRMWRYSSPRMDAVLDEARRTPAVDKQRDLYRQYQQIMVDEVPGIIAYVSNVATAYRTSVKNYRTNPFLWLDLADVENVKAP
ncbi:ABC transporter substrate-binding protein [Bosea sp. (in: a-proteobacteria)]|jgi:peptide/nickel transport system substrate-binding protein|uniref:ABC transporter substrate-binding protein n=1 Tax=Bosea sp. (in: a-proteobacteria) TaxID=1871050 RepID=UPI001AD13E03|nr:ABC transporter substrate-binding protein [Bosea sp. (in: a-proteobacteria)]MBN9435412.1 ABC transporter substrate-binding protein [Bosea sp. (in: a-proteobacteria)]MBN9471717.1 ABC transporter substrate-binding protein [Bosea sp. (in: a-proteobacteria)]